ncbi:MurR/RpiR family transcriptional regulator [Liquorilactobacillus nagelii]|uniref:MurR/RpiR family transcriptional regulator n=1 Tax=Liquorilactobacillus nagelii TaxID=82688 RepID=UPI001CD021ED|nr:MurR/RpiR family transcriptional regulator [Liquorilactobacillus nagelii]ULQ48981.1 MurR/RpiR family transcriptional regulator [Liquorilactobacillus nagelii]
MSVKGELLNLLADLSRSEQKVANYIIANPQAVISMTVAQLAIASKTSPSAVIRLVKHLKSTSYTTMKVDLAADISRNQSNSKFYADIAANESLTAIEHKLLANAQQTLQETSDQIKQTEITKLVDELSNSQQILLFGIGASALVAENISQKWSRLGYAITVDNDLNLLLPKLVSLNSQSMLWIISNSGESPEALVAANTAHKFGVKVISLTRFGKNHLFLASDIGIHTSQPPEDQQRIAATSSLLAQFMVIDLIFYYFVSQNFERYSKVLAASRQAVIEYHNNFNSEDYFSGSHESSNQ